jgi:hypothetical protein
VLTGNVIYCKLLLNGKEEYFMSKKIVVLNRSWNVVGDVEMDGDFYLIFNGFVIRRWGTTKGIGELAINGPLSETILDSMPLMKAHKDQVIFVLNCDESKWK